ncbi:hypothetical protein JAAARDRAFT_200887 [Jaapia argillacea MUCL 33604]|uniref:Uncharacterized protein n=1 Tax=Jaapia argillacea MUCL 33604 TaxID=933084 RepID=A0A067P3S0_9AGAM|nr:hypothetical protein JAAARDRAFT_200887 [Jaapia argillacea MUCL 33604]
MVEDRHPPYDFVDVDKRLDRDGDNLPGTWGEELRAARARKSVLKTPARRSQRLVDTAAVEEQWIAAKQMEEAVNQEEEEGIVKHGLEVEQPTIPTILPGEDDPTIQMSLTSGPPLRERVEQDVDFMMAVRKGYMQDLMFRKIIENPKHHRGFIIRDGLILTRNRAAEEKTMVKR